MKIIFLGLFLFISSLAHADSGYYDPRMPDPQPNSISYQSSGTSVGFIVIGTSLILMSLVSGPSTNNNGLALVAGVAVDAVGIAFVKW
jgi:hypothetical protein